jgi:hypothetical protein
MARDAEQIRDDQAELMRRRSAARREVGEIPPIADVRRRGRCRRSLRLFCETYNREAFSIAWSNAHLDIIARIEEAVTHGALFAFAMPRGSGKTTIVRMAALWALSYALCRYVFVIGANQERANDTLESLRMAIRFLPRYAADFPEVAWPAQHLQGIANRASGQTCRGESTLIEWSADRIVLPTVPPPANWPKAWPLRSDGRVPTSGCVVSASGLTGEGIRGSLLTLSTGEMIRPDLVLIDDPQTRESAMSPSQNAKREALISADVLGMAGPGRSIAAVMPCTVIYPGDMVDRILDRSRHPLWRGERTRLLNSLPSDLEAWEQYFEIYRRCAQSEPPDFAEANRYYRDHRAALDAGAEASWPQRKQEWEVSAIQSAMHLYCRDRRAFFAEYQNEPLPPDAAATVENLEPEAVAARLNRCPRGAVPASCTRLTAGIDVGGSILYWVVCAWDERFGGAVVDYGTWPRQPRSYFAAADARPRLEDEYPRLSEPERVYAGLRALIDQVAGRAYPQSEGGELRVSQCLIDAGWQTQVVHQVSQRSQHAAVLLPSKGYYVGESGRPMSDWKRDAGVRCGRDWRVHRGPHGRYVLFDSNAWKTVVANALQAPEGGAGCLLLFGERSHDHQLFADHLCAEFRTPLEGRWRKVEVWRRRPDGGDNHYFDALVLAAVAASVSGLVCDAGAAVGEPAKAPPPRKRLSLADIQRQRLQRSTSADSRPRG